MKSKPGLTLKLDDQLCFALYSAGLAMDRIYRRLLRPLNLTYPQYLVMLVLWERDGISVSGLGERLYLDSATLTPLLKRLEILSLVSRRRDAHDERQVLVTLTDAGRALKSRAEAVPNALAAMSPCDPARLLELKQQLEQLRRELRQAA